MSRGCSGGVFAATTTTTTSMLAAIARRRAARAGRRARGGCGGAAPRSRGERRAPFDEHVVADGELALLAAGEVGRQSRRDLAPGAVFAERRRPGAATMPVTTPRSPAPTIVPGRGVASGPSASSAPTSSSRKSSSSSRGPPGLCVLSAALRSLAARLVSLFRSPVSSSASRLFSESSALLLVHRWKCPSVGFRHGRARRVAPGASPARAVGRDVRAARVPRKRRSGGAQATYDRALELGDAGIPLTALAVITSPPSAGGSVRRGWGLFRVSTRGAPGAQGATSPERRAPGGLIGALRRASPSRGSR